jgi:hypothetical protein
MGEDQLLRGKGRLHRLRRVHPGAEKGHLEAELASSGTRYPGLAGDVPPLGAQLRMRAVVTRKHERAPGQCRGDGRGGQARPGQWPTQSARKQQVAPAHHQSSFTASTASRPAAARPDSQAVTVPAATTAAHRASRRAQGAARSMVQ